MTKESFRTKSPETEKAQRPKLSILEIPDKRPMISFDGAEFDEITVWAYNEAIKTVMKKEGLDPFHQIGADPSNLNRPVRHGWEPWKKITKEGLEALIPEIEKKAEQLTT